MSVPLPESARALLLDRAYGHVITINRDGTPQASMVWMDVDGDEPIFNTHEGRMKPKNLRRDPRIWVSIPSREDPQQYLLVSGTARVESAGAVDHVLKIAERFMGRPQTREQWPQERLIVRITPECIAGSGPWVS